MPILNYTTKIEARKTAGEISEMLADLGADSVQIEYDSKKLPMSISFSIKVERGNLTFRLPSRWNGVYKTLIDDPQVIRSLKTEEQARRIAWRITKNWVEAQIAIIQSGAVEMSEVFLPYVVNPQNGKTLFEDFKKVNLTLNVGDIIEGEYSQEEK